MAHYVDSPATFVSAEALAAWRRVKFTSAARTVEYADAAEDAIGVTEHSCASGDPVTVRMLANDGTFKIMLVSASCSVGDTLYAAADGKLSTTVSAGSQRFRALNAGTAANDVIEVSLKAVNAGEVIQTIVANGTALTNSTVETALATKSVDGTALAAGDVIEVFSQGICTSTNSTDTLNVKLYLGTEEICATGAVDVANSDCYQIHAFITVRTTGASGTVVAGGTTSLGAPGTATALLFDKASATEDISGSTAVVVKGTWSVASASNSVRAMSHYVVVHKA